MDELPQLVNIQSGDMNFVGTRPEVVKYVEKYKPEYYATLLLPAKMMWNLESIERFRFLRDILTMIRTVLAVLGKEYK